MRCVLAAWGLLRSLARDYSGQPRGQGLHLMAKRCHLGGQGLQRGVAGRGHGMFCPVDSW